MKLNKTDGIRLDMPVIVIHVKNGYEDRERHIRKVLQPLGVEPVWILDGDRDDMDSATVDRWFSGSMNKIDGESSCALKHFLAYRYIVDNNLPGALIVEDDMVPSRRFAAGVKACVKEMYARHMEPGLLSMEDSSLQFVKGHERRRGQMVYEAARDRFTGCYYVPAQCAKLMLDYVAEHKCDMPIDRWHTSLITRAGLKYYWSHPTFASQGSHRGMFCSAVSSRRAGRRTYKRMMWGLKKAYKQLLYTLR